MNQQRHFKKNTACYGQAFFGLSMVNSKGLNDCPICLPVGSDAGQDGSQPGYGQSQVEPQHARGVILEVSSVRFHGNEPDPNETWERFVARP